MAKVSYKQRLIDELRRRSATSVTERSDYRMRYALLAGELEAKGSGPLSRYWYVVGAEIGVKP